ncbi:MAG: LicD family protein [Clostridia bacterium]|nr:LicD family protein [Clostridia bacterium]
MRKVEDIVEIRAVLVELLSEIKQICDEHGLKYFLAYGTLLGAVRHKGFIPWDDDLDIEMPRPDYEKFIEIYRSEKRENILYEQKAYPDYLYSFAKLVKRGTKLVERGCDCGVEMGLYVDIFPVDALGDDVEEAKKHLKKTKLPIRLLMSYRMDFYRPHVSWKRNLLVQAAKIIAPLYGKKRLIRTLEKRAFRFDYDTSKYVGSFISEINMRRIFEKKVYEERIELEFEGKLFAAPKAYDEVLKKQYGDYMTLPPEDQRVLTHGYDAYIED